MAGVDLEEANVGIAPGAIGEWFERIDAERGNQGVTLLGVDVGFGNTVEGAVREAQWLL